MKAEYIPFIVLTTIFGAHYIEHRPTKEEIESKEESIYNTRSFEDLAYQIGKPIIADCFGKDDFTSTCVPNDEDTFLIVPVTMRNDSESDIDITDYGFYIVNGWGDEIYQSPLGQSALFMSGSYSPDTVIKPNMQTITYAIYEVNKEIAGFDICIESKFSWQCTAWH